MNMMLDRRAAFTGALVAFGSLPSANAAFVSPKETMVQAKPIAEKSSPKPVPKPAAKPAVKSVAKSAQKPNAKSASDKRNKDRANAQAKAKQAQQRKARELQQARAKKKLAARKKGGKPNPFATLLGVGAVGVGGLAVIGQTTDGAEVEAPPMPVEVESTDVQV